MPVSNSSANPASIADASVIEIVGKIKWYDPEKRYGFVALDDGRPDVMLPESVVKRSGFEASKRLYGALAVCDAVAGKKGIQATRIKNLTMFLAPGEDPPPRDRSKLDVVVPTKGWERGTLKWFDRRRGYGFLYQLGVSDEFMVHAETFRRGGIDPSSVRNFDDFEMCWHSTEKGRQVTFIRECSQRR